MPRRHRNVLLKFILFLPFLYFIFSYISVENTQTNEQSIGSNIENVQEEENKLQGEPIRRKEDKDIVLDIPILNIEENHQESDLVENENIIEKPVEEIIKNKNLERDKPDVLFNPKNELKLDNIVEKDNPVIRENAAIEGNAELEQNNVEKDKHIEEKLEVEVRKEKQEENNQLVLAPPQDPNGPGEMGKPVKIKDPDVETKKKIDLGWRNNAFNQYVSDLISVHRSLPDLRNEWCKAPDRNLPTNKMSATSVIICFHNEAWSTLLRTVHSVLNRSPADLIHEIVLVDDASDMEHVKEELDHYMSQYPKVKIIRLTDRVGLIRARLAGASKAEASTLTYLDSHCECTDGWLEPLLDRIARNPTTVVCPVIDVLNEDTLAYQGGSYFALGGFDWNLQFNWHSIPEHERKRRSHSFEPAWSPTMAGGLFAIDRSFFEKLGSYDPGFDIWGAENLELSFKTWMCGGTLEIVPCSHVGHIFRKRSPYKWRSGVNALKRNSIRLAEVWMDDYKKYYYDRVGPNLGEYGDISSRKELRKNLNCKSFKWYLDNIFPELFIPGESLASGDVKNPWSNHCVDSASQPKDMHKPVKVWQCHNQGGNQYWMLSKNGEIRRDDACLDFGGTDVILYTCHGAKGNQWWSYNNEDHTMRHVATRKCLAITGDMKKLTVEECVPSSPRQVWILPNFDIGKIK